MPPKPSLALASPLVPWVYCLVMKVRDVIKMIEADGWYLVATRGSHRQYKHKTKPGRVTIAGRAADDLAPGTLNSVLKQAGLTREARRK